MLYTPVRGLLQAQWQSHNANTHNEHPVAELRPNEFAAIYRDSIFTDEGNPEWLGLQPSFDHPFLKEETAYTYSGWLACHVMYPFNPDGDRVNAIVSVWESDEDFRVVQVESKRLRVATASIAYISPVEQPREFLEIRAKTRPGEDSPRFDTLM